MSTRLVRRLRHGLLALLGTFAALPLADQALADQALANQPGAPQPVRAIVGGTVVNLDGGKPIENAVILIQGERITAVGPAGSVAVPAGAEQVDARGKWLMPGLMNMHVHLGLVLPGAQGMELMHESDAALGLRMLDNARKTLWAGTTTVRLPSDTRHGEFAVKAAIDKGTFDGPRIFAAGNPILPTGGHGAEEVGLKPVDGKDAVMQATRTEIAAGASWIKLMISKGLADSRGSIAASDMTPEEIAAAVFIAHRQGVKVAAHTGSPQATMEALDAGVDSFEHGYYLTEEVYRKMKQKGGWYVPTIVVSQSGALEFFQKIGAPQWYLERAKEVGQSHWKSLQTAIRVGVNIAMGTDQFPYEPNEGTVASVRELELYVDAGMTPVQALRTATVNTAKMLGIEADAGRIEAGKYADIIALAGDPAKDIHALRTLGFVMKGGKVIRNDWAR